VRLCEEDGSVYPRLSKVRVRVRVRVSLTLTLLTLTLTLTSWHSPE